MFYLKLRQNANKIKSLKVVLAVLFLLISHEKTVSTELSKSETLKFIFKRIFIFDLNHETLEVNIMGDNSLLFIKPFEESIAKSVKCCINCCCRHG